MGHPQIYEQFKDGPLGGAGTVCAIPGAQKRGTWGTHLWWLCLRLMRR